MIGALLVYDLLFCGIAAVAVWRQRSGSLRRGLILTAAIVAAGGVGAVVASVPFGKFGLLRFLCHWLFAVMAPTIALVGLLRIRRSTLWASMLVVLGGAMEFTYVWASWVEPFRLDVTQHVVRSPRLVGLTSPIRVAVIADLQTDRVGAYEERVFEALVDAKPDLVVFLGDYLQLQRGDDWFDEEQRRLRDLLGKVSPRLGMFAVEGDIDWMGLERIFAGTSVQVVTDRTVVLPTEPPIQIVGLGRERSRRMPDVGTARAVDGFDGLSIVLGHAPDFMRAVLERGWRPDALLLAGHTHGGQIVVPGFGPPITLTSAPRWLAAGGLFEREGSWLGVSRGIGMERATAPRIRLFCRPQLMLVDLQGTR